MKNTYIFTALVLLISCSKPKPDSEKRIQNEPSNSEEKPTIELSTYYTNEELNFSALFPGNSDPHVEVIPEFNATKISVRDAIGSTWAITCWKGTKKNPKTKNSLKELRNVEIEWKREKHQTVRDTTFHNVEAFVINRSMVDPYVRVYFYKKNIQYMISINPTETSITTDNLEKYYLKTFLNGFTFLKK